MIGGCTSRLRASRNFVSPRLRRDWAFVKPRSLFVFHVLKSSKPPKLVDTTSLITPPCRPESIPSKMAQKSPANIGITDNINSLNVINANTGISIEDNRIREWLSPLNPQQRHRDVRADRLDGVGNWVLETSEFLKWSNGEDGYCERVLFCSGGPGVGKTYLR